MTPPSRLPPRDPRSAARPAARIPGGTPAAPDGLGRRLALIARRLAAAYGRPDGGAHEMDPVRNLVLTILSQNTNDANRDRAFLRLVARFPEVSSLAAAPAAEIEEAIRPAGLARAKAAAIRAALGRLRDERGAYDLSFLRRMGVGEARAYLTSFPGVGVKTANVVLLFSFGLPAFPVDTHILRVARRLGLVPPGADLARAALALEPHVPPGEHAPLHLNLIRLGREVCRPARPRHEACPLRDLCPEGQDPGGGGTVPEEGVPRAGTTKGGAGAARRERGGGAAGRRGGGPGRTRRASRGAAPPGGGRSAAGRVGAGSVPAGRRSRPAGGGSS